MNRPARDCECPKARHAHGTQNMYLYHACRCTLCREAHATEARNVIRLQAYGRYDRTMQDARPIREHVKILRENGIVLTRIAELAGTSAETITRLHNGIGKKVTARTAQRILAIKPTRDNARPGTIIDGTGTARRLQALVTLGWTQAQIADRLGVTHSQPPRILAGEPVTVATANKVAALYEQMWDTKPNPQTRHERRAATLSRNTARANGWLPPLAWDEDQIDNPKHRGYAKEVAA